MSENLTKISVGLCSYNGERYLPEQLDSILQQSRPPDEIVVCDDGSTDGTLNILNDYAVRFPGIFRIVQNDSKLGVTRNFEKAITLASGDLIFLSDQDDVWLPERVLVMSQLFAEHSSVGMVYANFAYTDEHLQPLTVRRPNQFREPPLPRQPQSVMRNWGNLLGCTLAIRSSLKPLLLPFPTNWSHDAWLSMIAYIFSEVRWTGDEVMYYRMHTGSSSGNTKYTQPTFQEIKTKVKRSQIYYYTDERWRWTGLYDRLLQIQAQPDLAPDYHAALERFLGEVRRRAEFAQARENLKQRPRLSRLLPALRLMLAGDYHHYLNGVLTFGKDILLA